MDLTYAGRIHQSVTTRAGYSYADGDESTRVVELAIGDWRFVISEAAARKLSASIDSLLNRKDR